MKFFFAGGGANLHSPGAIGDVTPGTIGATTVTSTGAISANGVAVIDPASASILQLFSGGHAQVIHGLVQLKMQSGYQFGWVPTTPDATNPDIYLFRGAAGKLVASTDGSTINGAIQGKLTTDTAAMTGLVAGVLAGTTNTSILLYDANGVAYDVPCKAH